MTLKEYLENELFKVETEIEQAKKDGHPTICLLALDVRRDDLIEQINFIKDFSEGNAR